MSETGSSSTVRTFTIAGVIVLAFLLIVGFVSFFSGSHEPQRLTADAEGVAALDVSTGSADLTIVFDDALEGEAVLTSNEGPSEWVLRRNGDTLVVDSHRTISFLGWLSFGPLRGQSVELRLPGELENEVVDAEFQLSSGTLRASGAYGELDVRVSSGHVEISGSARTVDASVSSGHLETELSGVTDARFGVSSGQLDAELHGDAPQDLELSVSSGFMSVEVPDVAYAVSSRVSSGSLDNLLRTDPSSSNQIDASVSSGSIELRAGAER